MCVCELFICGVLVEGEFDMKLLFFVYNCKLFVDIE